MNTGEKPKFCFMLGAGASIEAGVSTSEKITEILVNYGSYCTSEESTAIENLLKYIQVRIGDYLKVRASEVNFEYVLGTLVELSKREEYPIVPFLGEGDLLVRKLEEKTSLTAIIDRLYALLRELLFVRNPVNYLHPLGSFVDLCKPLDFFTLNYDLSLETAFEGLTVPFTTGYRSRADELPLWDPSEFEKESLEVRIFKLHGSVNWGQFFVYPPPPTKSEPYTDVIRAAEHYIAAYPESVAFDAFPIGQVEPPERTEGMVGIMNFGTRKELLYASSQFTVLFHHFLKTLREAKTCVMAGYSFRDDRINKMIEEAVITRKGDLHLIIVNPSVFWIADSNPLLRKLMDLKWATGIDRRFSDALQDGSLLGAVEGSFASKEDSGKIVKIARRREREDAGQEKRSEPESILESWRLLGRTFDLTTFWFRHLGPELTELEECAGESEAIKVGKVLMPLMRKVRDLCYRIGWVYEEMGLGGCYSGEYLETINVSPRLTKDFSRMELVRKWLPQLGMAVSYANSVRINATEEFTRAVTDPEYGKGSTAPSHLHVAGMVIRKTRGVIYELTCIVNDIYKGAGYEEPFERICAAEDESGG